MSSIRTEVVVVGAGPCGVTLANHLGLHGIDTVIIERSLDVLDYPRAVGVDDEALRSWQTVGLAQRVLGDMVQNAPLRYHNSRGRCFAQIRPAAQPYGWPRRSMFQQPLTEVALREGLARYPSVRQMYGVEAQTLVQDAEGVTLTAKTLEGEAVEIRCRYLVGTDGGRSTIRDLVGVQLLGATHTNKWLVVDVQEDQLDAPFSGVYCDPKRPHMVIDLPYGFRRFEFMLRPEDDEEALQTPENLARLMAPHYPHGVPRPQIKRSRVYLHHSRIAEKFRVGRVFLAGDAAHLQPPFFGQGMNSGLRDVTNLGWKLAAVLRDQLPDAALDSYNAERRAHALAMVNFATWIGRFYRPFSYFTERIRDLFFGAVHSLPSVREYILQLKFKPLPKYTEGLVIKGSHPALGTMFMQPNVETRERVQMRLDDAIGKGFCVLGVNVDPARHMSADDRAFWKKLGAVIVQVNRSRAGKHFTADTDADTIVLDDVQGRLRDWLDDNAPNDVILLRPDRYVAGLCNHADVGKMTADYRRVVGAAA